jgi:hypothetical protein
MVVAVFNDLGEDFRVNVWDGDGVVGADLCVNCTRKGEGDMLETRYGKYGRMNILGYGGKHSI